MVSKVDLQGWDYVESHEFFDHVRIYLSDPQFEYSDWVKAIQEDRAKHEGSEEVHDLGFMPIPAPWTPDRRPAINTPSLPQGAFSDPFATIMPKINSTMEGTADQIVDAGSKFIQAQIARAGDALKSRFGDRIGIEAGFGGDGGTTKENYGGGSNYNKHGLSLGAKPINSMFTTDIIPRFRPLYFNDGSDSDAPLILYYGQVFPELGDGNTDFAGDASLQRFLNIDVFNQWSADLARNLRLNSYTQSLITEKYIFNFIRIQMHALSIYYFFVSIIAHINVPENRNSGMISLYEALSAEDLQEIARLELLLKKTPIDPRINQYVFHLYNNYKQSELPSSPLYKLIPVPFQDSSTTGTSSLVTGSVTAAIDMLGSTKYKEFVQGYVQAYPDVNSELLMYTGIPNHDLDHLTFVRNFPHIGYGSATTNASTHLPTATDNETRLVYNLDTDAPDGWAFASSGIWVGSNYQSGGKLSGGFGGPKTLGAQDADGYYTTELMVTDLVHGHACKTTTMVFGPEVSGGRFVSASNWEGISDVVSQSYKICRSYSAINAFQRSGCQIATPVSVEDMEKTAEEFANFMFTPPNTSRPSRTPRSAGNRRGRRGKGKASPASSEYEKE